MVTIVTGKIDSGKTTTLLKHHEVTLSGDGFVAIKKTQDKNIYGFNLMRLSNKNELLWMVHQQYYHEDFKRAAKFGPYYLNLDLLGLVEIVADELIASRISPIYLDEVGVLELNGGGYHNTLKKIIESGLDLVIAVREDLVQPVVKYFAIQDYELLIAQKEG